MDATQTPETAAQQGSEQAIYKEKVRSLENKKSNIDQKRWKRVGVSVGHGLLQLSRIARGTVGLVDDFAMPFLNALPHEKPPAYMVINDGKKPGDYLAPDKQATNPQLVNGNPPERMTSAFIDQKTGKVIAQVDQSILDAITESLANKT